MYAANSIAAVDKYMSKANITDKTNIIALEVRANPTT